MSLRVFIERPMQAVLLLGLVSAGPSACTNKPTPTAPSTSPTPTDPPSWGADGIERPEAVSILCTGDGQLCSPRYALTLGTRTFIHMRFVASPSHCANVTVALFIDGVESGSALLRPDESSPAWRVTVARGTHLVELEGRGVVGGCNTGRLTGWAGTAFFALD